MNAWTWFTKEMLLELWETNDNEIINYSDIIRYKIKDKIESIVENRWYDLMYYLWNKTIPWTNLDSEIHQELSKKYPYDYSDALISSWMWEISWLSQFWLVLRNLIVYLKDKVSEKEYKETLYTLFSLIPDLTKIPIFDINLLKKNLWNKEFENIMNNRTIKEQNYIYTILQKYHT